MFIYMKGQELLKFVLKKVITLHCNTHCLAIHKLPKGVYGLFYKSQTLPGIKAQKFISNHAGNKALFLLLKISSECCLRVAF